MPLLRIAGIASDSCVDGLGVRYTVFLQGCAHGCPGCHNPASHDYGSGEVMDSKTIFQDILSLKYIRGVTFSGGEPLDQAVALAPLMKDLRGQGYNIWIYTGYTFEEAAADSLMSVVVRLADVLVDGRFVRSKRTLTIPFIGSENQRVIDVQESLRQGKVQLFTPRIVWIGKQTPHFNSGLYY